MGILYSSVRLRPVRHTASNEMLTSKSGDACACASVRSIRKSERLERDRTVFNGLTYDLWSTNHGAVLLKNAFVNDESSVRGVSVVPFRRLGARLPDLFCHCDQTSERFDENLHALLDSKINATVGDNDVATLFR